MTTLSYKLLLCNLDPKYTQKRILHIHNILGPFYTTANETLKWEREEVHIPHITAGMLKINGEIQTEQLPLQIEPRRAASMRLSFCVEPVCLEQGRASQVTPGVH